MKYFKLKEMIHNFRVKNANFINCNDAEIIIYIIAGEMINMELNKEYYINGIINENVDHKKDYNTYIINNNEYSCNLLIGHIYMFNCNDLQYLIAKSIINIIEQLYNNINLKYNISHNMEYTDQNNLLFINNKPLKRRIKIDNTNLYGLKINCSNYLWNFKFNNNMNKYNYYNFPIIGYSKNTNYNHIYSLNSIIIDNMDLFNIKNELRFPNYPSVDQYAILEDIYIFEQPYIYSVHANILPEIAKRFLHIDIEYKKNIFHFNDCNRNVYYINYDKIKPIKNLKYVSKDWIEEIKTYLDNYVENNKEEINDEINEEDHKEYYKEKHNNENEEIIDDINDEIIQDEIKTDEIKTDEINADEIIADENKTDEEIIQDEIIQEEIIQEENKTDEEIIQEEIIQEEIIQEENKTGEINADEEKLEQQTEIDMRLIENLTNFYNINKKRVTYNNIKCYFTGIPLYDQFYIIDIYKYKNKKINTPIHIQVSPFVIHFMYPNFIEHFELLTNTKIILFKSQTDININDVINKIYINKYDKKILKSLYLYINFERDDLIKTFNISEDKIPIIDMYEEYKQLKLSNNLNFVNNPKNIHYYLKNFGKLNEMYLINDDACFNINTLIYLIKSKEMKFLANVKII
jgi:hypothetical protein